MTVQTLLNKAVAYIDDTENIADYGAAHLPFVSQVVAELMRLKIGVNSQFQCTKLADYTAAYTPVNADYIPITTSVLSEDQIISVEMDGYTEPLYTETVNDVVYLLVPDTTQVVQIEYVAPIVDFTATTEDLPIADSAAIGVAAIGVAALLSLAEAPEKTNYLQALYESKVKEWRKRLINAPRHVIDVYGYNGNSESANCF